MTQKGVRNCVIKSILTGILLLCCFTLMGQENEVKSAQTKVGLVLAGGGAKGFAHIGVLRVLEREGIQVDYITGTSMGALVGALYAAGYSPDELEEIVRSQNWSELFSDKIYRRHLSIEEKIHDERYLLSFQFEDGKIQLPRGLVSGQKVSTLLTRLTSHLEGENDFEALGIPFTCVATDIETGEAVVFSSGSLPEALRASISIPTVFTPAEYQGRTLVDGGVVRNLPVQDVKAMGADVVIGVDVGSLLKSKELIQSAPDVMEQTLTLYALSATRSERDLCDIVMDPDVGNYGTASFDKAEEIIAIGEQAAEAQLDRLREYSVEGELPIQVYRRLHPRDNNKTIVVSGFRVHGAEHYDEALIIRKMGIESGDSITVDDIEEGISKLYGTKFFDSIKYEVSDVKGDTVLDLTVKEKPASTFNIGGNYNNDTNASILFNLTLRDMLLKNSVFFFDAQLGEYLHFYGSYMRPFELITFLSWELEAWHHKMRVDAYIDSEKEGTYYGWFNGMAIRVQTHSLYDCRIGAGFAYEYNRLEKDITTYDISGDVLDSEYTSPFLFFEWDTLDRTVYPTSGTQLYAEAKYIKEQDRLIREIDVQDKPNEKVWIEVENYIELIERFTIRNKVFAGGIFGGTEIPYDQRFSFGGFTAYSGTLFPVYNFHYMQEAGNYAQLWTTALQLEVLNNFFIIPELDALRVQEERSEIEDDVLGSILWGYGVILGLNTPVGPVELNGGSNSESKELLLGVTIGFEF